MKTKICTDIDQSKKLLELGVDVNTADMCLTWVNNKWNEVVGNADKIREIQISNAEDRGEDSSIVNVIPAWSLVALHECLPSGIDIDGTLYVFESHNTFDNEWVYEYKFEDSAPLYSKLKNEIDVAVDMIIKLHKEKFI